MSTLSATNLKNASSGSNNIVLNTDGSIGGTCLTQTCRAWVNFNGTGVVAIRASYNVSSITDNGAGDYTVNFTTAFADANYAASTAVGDTSAVGCVPYNAPYLTQTTSQFRLQVVSGALVPADRTHVSVSVFR